jgi:hypothetical protein
MLAHPAESRWQDIHRDNAAAVGGNTTLRFGWTDVTRNPCQVAARVAAVLSQKGYSQCRPCSAACPVGLTSPNGVQPNGARPKRTQRSEG